MSLTDGRCTRMQDFTVEIIGPTGDCAVLQITGELDAYTAPILRDRMRDLTAVGVVNVIADLRQVEFLDSTGLTTVFPPRPTVADAIDADPHWREVAEDKAGSAAEWCSQHDLV